MKATEFVVLNDKLAENVELLLQWNKNNVEKEPEQVRKNMDTIINVITNLNHSNF